MFASSTTEPVNVMSAEHASSGNNRPATTATFNNKQIEYKTAYGVFEVKQGKTSSSFAFYDIFSKKYLSGKSGRSNNLVLSSTLDEKSSFTITDEGVKVVSSDVSKNTLKWNNSYSIFSLYSSGQNPVYIYEKSDPVYATDFTLTGDSEISEGKTSKLTVNYIPAETNQKNATFKSNDTSVLTVDDSGLMTAVKEGSTSIDVTVTGENEKKIVKSFSVTVTEAVLDAYTIMIYMCGSDLESGYDSESGQYYDSYLASSDLDEIKSVNNQPSDVNIIIEAGGSRRWDSSYSSLISTSKLNRFHLENGSYVKDEQIARANMGASSTFQSFLEWGLTN